MPITIEQMEETRPVSDSLAVELEQTEPGAEAEPNLTEKEKRGGAISHSPKKRRPFRWVVLLLVIGLAGAGYAYRERLLGMFSKEATQGKQIAWRKVSDQAYRRANDRRDVLLLRARAVRLPGDLCDLEVAYGSETPTGAHAGGCVSGESRCGLP
jgi:hypothetical protein